GSHPTGTVNPLALQTLRALGVSCGDFRSKNWQEFTKPDSPHMDFVFTVCDNAAGEVCPIWPGQPMTAHWGVADPAAVEGTDQQKAQGFFDAATTLKRRIERFIALPLRSMNPRTLKRELAHIAEH